MITAGLADFAALVVRVLDPVEAAWVKPDFAGLEVLGFAGLFFAVLKADLSLGDSAAAFCGGFRWRDKPRKRPYKKCREKTFHYITNIGLITDNNQGICPVRSHC